ncbi:MAG: dihydrodipicolinate synthase family protein [Armatimonadota bacterium]|nr:dihydrodipicolinate synthase family protein [Armatimonadota bacterium]
MTEFKGVVAAILTPFDDEDRIDFEYVKRLLRFVEDEGCNGFVVSGTNGEFPSMSVEERMVLIETCASHKGRMFMVAGTGCSNLRETIELTKFAESVGADAAMVVPPYFFFYASEFGIVEYYKRVFDAVSLPIFLYNIPQCSGIRITDAVVEALACYPHLAGVKDSSGDLGSTLHYITAYPKLQIFVGDDHHCLTALAAGAAGHVSGMPNAFPRLVTELYAAFVEGRDAWPYQMRLSMARHIYSAFPEFAVNKFVLSRRGFPVRHCRLPLVDLTETQKLEFEKLMRAAGLWDVD